MGALCPHTRGMNQFRDIIGIWPSLREAAAEIGVDRETVKSWAQRNRIPAEHDVAVVRAASARGVALSYEHLAQLRARDIAA